MYRVLVKRHFDAAHALRGYRGKCENLHGHRWEIVVCAQREDLDHLGMAVDFGVLKRALDGVLKGLDHTCLNEVLPFDAMNPSSENIARVVYEQMEARLPDVQLVFVEAWESPDAWARYSR